MANVRIAQIGQLAANRPIFEVIVDTRRYAFAVGKNGRVAFKDPSWLASLGVCSVVCDSFFESIEFPDRAVLGLDSNLSTTRERFASQTYGSGYTYVPDYSPQSGWKTAFPANGVTFNL